jgi:uncharacterized spore protein YtfJ
MEQNLAQNVDTLFSNMQNFAQKEGLIGKAVTQADKTFLPIISVTLGYGGGDTQTKGPHLNANSNQASGSDMSGGAVGLGAKLATDAVIVINKDNVTLMPISGTSGLSQLVDKVPQILSNMGSGGQQNQQSQQQQPK